MVKIDTEERNGNSASQGDVIKTGAALPPTIAEYSGLQTAFEHFNKELFDGGLPNVMIVETRRAHSYGHLAPNRFATREGDARFHELSLNPDMFFGRPDKEVLGTLVHEAVHVLQEVRGTAPKGNYHNKDFAAQMKDRGLYASNTGAPGGKETGAQMSHCIIPGGAFELSYERLQAKGWKLALTLSRRSSPVRAEARRTRRNSSVRFATQPSGASRASSRFAAPVWSRTTQTSPTSLNRIA